MNVRPTLWPALACLMLSLLPVRADETPPADAAPAALFEVDALAAQLTTPRAAFAFVCDRIASEPYSGVMKGAAGTLLTRGGNDWDRALLLARLLAAQGVETTLVGAAAPAAGGAPRSDSAVDRPDAAGLLLASLPRSKPADSPRAERIRVRLAQRTKARTAALAALETAPRELLEPVVAGLTPATPPRQTERVWLRATVDGDRVDLDPAGPEAKFGVAPAVDGEIWESSEPREDAWHTLTVKLVAERLGSAGELERAELLSRGFRAADLLAAGFRFAILPRAGKEHAGDFQAQLLAGGDTLASEPFRLSERPAPPGAAGGMFGALGDDETPPAAATRTCGPVLARLWVEFTLEAPGQPAETLRRTILDRAEPEKAAWRLLPTLAAEEKVRPLLLQSWDGALDVGAPHPAAVLQAGTRALAALEPLILAAKTRTRVEPGDIAAPAVSPQLLGFFLASGLRRHALCAGAGAPVRLVQVRPRLALLRRGFEVADWTRPGATPPRLHEGIDLLNTPFRCTGPAERAARTALQAGIADTALEVHALHRPADWNTLPILAEAGKAKLAVQALRTAGELRTVEAPPAIRAVLAAELAAGRTLVMPRQPVAWRGSHAVAWWSVDPASGYALGRVGLGGGQGLVEVTKMHERISDWTEIFAKFYGGVMDCYLGALGEALGSVEPDWENADVKVTINHGEAGETPLPSATQLTQCVIDAACEALSDLLTSYLSEASAAEAEAEALREMIIEWLNEKAIEKAGEATSEACNEFLSNAAGTGGGD